MTDTMTDQQPKYRAIDLYAKWTAAAKDTRWRYRDARVNEFHKAMDRAAAWSDGAAHVHTADDIAAYLAERIDADDTKAAAGVIARERARNIAAMSADGMSYAEIAQALGITRARAQQLVGAGREAS